MLFLGRGEVGRGRRSFPGATRAHRTGTDHGRGFAMIAYGAGILGGKVYGEWPGLSDNQEFTLGPQGLAIKHDFRSVLAEVLSGRAAGATDVIFPKFVPRTVGFVA